MRVLVEAAPLAWAATTSGYRSGIPRYIHELLRAFHSHDLGVRPVVGVWDEDVIACALKPWIESLWPDVAASMTNGYESRFRLGPLYRKAAAFRGPSRRSSDRALGAVAGVLRTLDRRQRALRLEVDVYHSPHVVLSNHKLLTDVPRVLTLHDLLPLTHPQYFTRQTIRDFERMAGRLDRSRDVIICDSRSTQRAALSTLGVSAARCWHVPLAAPESLGPVGDPASIERVLERWGLERGRYLLSVATLEPRKNIPRLLRCFLELRRSGELPGWKLVLTGGAGWGDTERDVQRFREERRGDVVLTGVVDDEDLSALYTGAGIFVFIPSIEGFGLPPLEAMQCGAPAIVANCSSLPEVVGDAALLVDPEDAIQLGSALRRLAADPALRDDLRTRGFERARCFSWRRTAEMTRDVYQAALDSRAR